MKVNYDKHYEWQYFQHVNRNPDYKSPEYYYVFTPVASLTIVDYRNCSEELKGKPYYKPFHVRVDTKEESGYDETVSHSMEVKGITLEEVKKEALEFFKKYAEDEMYKFGDVALRLDILK